MPTGAAEHAATSAAQAQMNNNLKVFISVVKKIMKRPVYADLFKV